MTCTKSPSRGLGIFAVLLLGGVAACGADDEVAETATTSDAVATTEIATTIPEAPPSSPPSPTAAPPTATPTPVPPTPTPDPAVAITLPGYEDVEVRTVCISVDQSYPQLAADHEVLLAATVADALDAMGLAVEEADCDAELSFVLTGSALDAEYGTEDGWVTYYTGAAYTGSAQFAVRGHDAETLEVEGRHEPPFMVTDQRIAPADAPFAAAFLEPMLTVLSHIWGPLQTLESIASWPQGDYFETLTDGARAWISSEARQIMDRLLEMRLAPDFRVTERAYEGLGEIVVREAVEPEELSKIVRTLIDDLATPDDYPGQVLRRIAEDPETGYFPSDDPMSVGPPWDAERWSQWADAAGY